MTYLLSYSLNQNTGELYEAGGWYVSDYCDILTGNDSGVVTLFVKNLLSNLVLKKQHHLSLVEEYRKIIKKVEEKLSCEQSEL